MRRSLCFLRRSLTLPPPPLECVVNHSISNVLVHSETKRWQQQLLMTLKHPRLKRRNEFPLLKSQSRLRTKGPSARTENGRK